MYQHGTLHPVVLPKKGYEDEILEFIEDMIDHSPDNSTLESIDYVRNHLVNCAEYDKIANILINYGVR